MSGGINKGSVDWIVSEISAKLDAQNREYADTRRDVKEMKIKLGAVLADGEFRDVEVKSIKDEQVAMKTLLGGLATDVAKLAGDRKAVVMWTAGALSVITVLYKFGWDVIGAAIAWFKK